MMREADFAALLHLVERLSLEQRTALGRALAAASGESEAVRLLEEAFLAAPRCPHCAATAVQRWGYASGLRRYRCTACRKTFNALTGTSLARLRKKECWLRYGEALAAGMTLVRAAAHCGVHMTTSFRWRHRFLKAPEAAREARAGRGRGRRDLFLGRQSWLAEELFEPAEVGGGIAAELRPQHPGVPTALEARAHLAPALAIDTGQIAGVPAAQPGDETGGEPHRTAQHGGRAVGLAAGRPPLVTAVRAEQPLEVVVGARQVGDGVAVEQAGAVAAGHLQEVVDGAGERAGLGAVARHGGEQPVEAAAHRLRRLAGGIPQDPGRPVDPGVGATDRWPQALRALEPAGEQPAQPPQRAAQPPCMGRSLSRAIGRWYAFP